jgi:RNA polymerase sigma-70 factor, ECF subfamily
MEFALPDFDTLKNVWPVSGRAVSFSIGSDSLIWRRLVLSAAELTKQEPLTDEEVVARVLAGQTEMFEIVIRRYNQRLYRVARAILRNDGEAEDVMQDAYVRAYQHLDQFAGRAKFSTWLTRIAVHEALARQRRRSRYQELEPTSEQEGDPMDRFAALTPSPEQQASNSEIRRLLEREVEKLPDSYRAVFMLRDVEEMSAADAAEALEITEDNVKVRLHRARRLLRKSLYAGAGIESTAMFDFHAVRCDRVVKNVFERIQKRISTMEA